MLVNVNARFPARLTTALLPVLAGGGAPALVVNVGSIAGLAPLPYTVVYNAAKAFVHAFSAGLGEELRVQGAAVEVLGVVSGSVDTAGAPADEQDAGVSLQPREMARSVLDSVGCGRALVFAHWKHWAQYAAVLNRVPADGEARTRELVSGVVTAAWLSGDPITWLQALGGALILGAGLGDVLTNRERPRATPIPVTVPQE